MPKVLCTCASILAVIFRCIFIYQMAEECVFGFRSLAVRVNGTQSQDSRWKSPIFRTVAWKHCKIAYYVLCGIFLLHQIYMKLLHKILYRAFLRTTISINHFDTSKHTAAWEERATQLNVSEKKNNNITFTQRAHEKAYRSSLDSILIWMA